MTRYIVTDNQNKANKILFNSPKFLEKRIAFSSKDSSPTGSYESNRRWAGKQYRRLIKLNNHLNLPAYSLTIKFTDYYDRYEISKCLDRFNTNLKRKLKDKELFAIAYKDIEPNNLVHLHLLAWSNLELTEIKRLITKSIPKAYFFTCNYAEPTDCVPAYSSYITGYCKNNRLLFKPNAIGRQFKYLGSLTQKLAREILDKQKKVLDKKIDPVAKVMKAYKVFKRIKLNVKDKDLSAAFINFLLDSS